MADGSAKIPAGGDGKQGLRTGQASDDYYCSRESKGSQDGGDWARTRNTGGLGHATVTSMNNDAPKSYYPNRSRAQDG